MWYKNAAAFGIRQAFGLKRQMFQLGGKRCTLSQDQLREIADAAVLKLAEGSSVADSKLWGLQEIQRRSGRLI